MRLRVDGCKPLALGITLQRKLPANKLNTEVTKVKIQRLGTVARLKPLDSIQHIEEFPLLESLH